MTDSNFPAGPTAAQARADTAQAKADQADAVAADAAVTARSDAYAGPERRIANLPYAGVNRRGKGKVSTDQAAADKAVVDAIEARDKAVAGIAASHGNLASYDAKIADAQAHAADVRAKAEAAAAEKAAAEAAEAAAKRAKTSATLGDVDELAARVTALEKATSRHGIN